MEILKLEGINKTAIALEDVELGALCAAVGMRKDDRLNYQAMELLDTFASKLVENVDVNLEFDVKTVDLTADRLRPKV